MRLRLYKQKKNEMTFSPIAFWLGLIFYKKKEYTSSYVVCISDANKGAFTFYVDKILRIFDPSLSVDSLFIEGLCTCADIWKTPPFLSFIYAECESPHNKANPVPT